MTPAVFGAVLVFEDSAVRKTNLLLRLPDAVVVASTSEFDPSKPADNA